MNDGGAGGADRAGDDRNSEKSSSKSTAAWTGGERAIRKGVCVDGTREVVGVCLLTLTQMNLFLATWEGP